jgi:hypothetical protein
VIALVATVDGAYAIDLESEELEPAAPFTPVAGPSLNLPRLRGSAQAGATVVALVDAKPPMLVSYDAGQTWQESGRGLPPGRAVAIARDNPDWLLYATRNRVYFSRDGGVFWTALAAELPEIESLALRES